MNMGPTTAFDAYQPYINLVKGSVGNWKQPFVDANGEVAGLPPGRTIAMNRWSGLAGPFQKVKTGPYVVKWSGGNATLTIVCRPGSYFDRAMHHVDSSGLVQAGARFYTLIDEIRTGLYVTPSTNTADDGSGELFHTNTRLKNIDWRSRSDAEIDALFGNGQAVAESRLRSFLKFTRVLRSDLSRSTYEWGQSCVTSVAGFAGTVYVGTVSASDNTFVWHGSTPASFTDGDAWLFHGPDGRYPIAGYRAFTLVYVKAKDPTRAWFFASDAARLADVGDTGTGAIVLDAASPGGTFTADNFTRTQQFGMRMKACLDGPPGKAMYQRFFAATIGSDKLRDRLCARQGEASVPTTTGLRRWLRRFSRGVSTQR